MTACEAYLEEPCPRPATRRIRVECADCGRTYGASAFCDEHEPAATKSVDGKDGFTFTVLPL